MLHNYSDHAIRKKENLLGIGFMLCMIVPHTNTAFLLLGPIFCVIFKLYLSENISIMKISLLVALSMVFTFIVNTGDELTSKGILSFVNILMIFLVFPNVGNLRIRNVFILSTFGVIFISQLAYVLNIPIFIQLLDLLYPSDSSAVRHMADTISFDTVVDYRMGGLYRNSNDCARAVNLLIGIFLINNNDIIKNKWNFFFLFLMFTSILFTGSRTGFVVAFFLIYLSFSTKNTLKSVMIALPTFILGYFIFATGSDSLRGLNVQQGLENSVGAKWLFFMDYVNHNLNEFKLIFGNFDAAKYHAYNGLYPDYFDSDYGNIIYCYGIIGFIIFASFFIFVFLRLKKEYKRYYVLFLWMISNSVVFSFRMFFIYMLLLSIYYSASKTRVASNNR